MSGNHPGGNDPANRALGATQVPTMFVQGPPIEKKELFRGRPAHLTEMTLHALGGALAAFGFVLMVVLFFASLGLLSLLGLLFSVIGGVLITWGFLRVIAVSYRVDTLRVEVERGILRRRIDNLELWRVKDIQFRQSLSQRMLGLGDIVLHTSDSTNPVIELRGIQGARALYDSLRDAVDAVRRGRGVVGVESAT